MNNQLKGTSSWINMFHGIDIKLPDGWANTKDIPVNFYKEQTHGE
jgi:hypothetical protein